MWRHVKGFFVAKFTAIACQTYGFLAFNNCFKRLVLQYQITINYLVIKRLNKQNNEKTERSIGGRDIANHEKP